ncbi:MAG: YfhO family protein [Planctomycetota bacterium]|nr:YfhO family protein [Planctomycetota bacterium]
MLLAILLPQFALFWPSLTGQKILLPLDVLTIGTNWIPDGEPLRREAAQDRYLSDLAMVTEINRCFAVSEVRAGRFPLWNPHIYCGAPFFASNHPAVLSPYRLLDYAWPGVEAIAWGQVLKALVAGLGAYLFLRRALQASFLASLTAAALFPLCGYMILWSGFTLANVASFLPWLLLATDATVKRPVGYGVPALALITALILLSGHAANAGHLFVVAILFAAWRVFELHGGASARAWRAFGVVWIGVLLGFALSAPQLLPTIEYMQESSRIAARAAGHIEAEPQGWWALLQMLLPYSLGSGERDAFSIVVTTRFEGAATAYAGLIATLVLAPLAFAHKEHRRLVLFFVGLAAFALVPLLDVPLLIRIFELPPLNLLRNNRFTIATAFALVALAAIGVDALVRGYVVPRRWHWIAIASCVLLVAFCILRLAYPLADESEPREFAWFRRYDSLALGVTCTALLAWFVIRRFGRKYAPVIVGACVLESTILAWGVNPQCERELYYPRLPVLDEIAKRDNGRMLGVKCILPNLAQAAGLDDVRGYDAADPRRIVDVLRASCNPDAREELDYAQTMLHVPKVRSGISDMLGLRWIVLQGTKPGSDVEIFSGYSLYENETALPRAFVPTQVATIVDEEKRIETLAADAFDPRAIAYVETDVPSAFRAPAAGSARVVDEVPSRVTLELELETNALVVLGDAYDAGWHATIDGRAAEVVPVNHALRGVFVERGAKRLEFTYWPKSLTLGLLIGGAALVLMCAWTFAVRKIATT